MTSLHRQSRTPTLSHKAGSVIPLVPERKVKNGDEIL